MRFASVWHDEVPLAVAIQDGQAIPLRGVAELGADTPSELLADPPLEPRRAIPVDELRFRPVVPHPGKVICVGLNYLAHVEESNRERPEYPVLFTKFATSLTGPFDAIACPPESGAIDYEGELVAVIGRSARRLDRAAAARAVAGYAVANDISMRDFQHKTHQWLQGKAWDATTPVGPELVSSDAVADPGSLRLRTAVNGEIVQDASTAQLMFDIPTLVSVISQFATLAPGDLILTGTPGGVGASREPPLLLSPGDRVIVEVEGVGRIENEMVAERERER